MKQTRFFLCWLLSLPLIAGLGMAQAPLYVATELGSLGGNSYAYGVNHAGQVTGRSFLADGVHYHMFLHSGGVMTDCTTASGYVSDFSAGYSISNRGEIAGTEFNSLAFPTLSQTIRSEHALRYSAGEITVIANEGHAYGINAAGDIAGAYGRRAGNGFSLYYTPALFIRQGSTSLLEVGGFFPAYHFAQSVNNTRQLAGRRDYTAHGTEQNYNLPFQAFFSVDGVQHSLFLGSQAGSDSSANGINSASQITGYLTASGGARHAFLFSNGAVHDLGALNGTSSIAYGINNAGQVTGSFTVGGADRAFLYSGGAAYDLNDLVPASQGITGIGENSQGNHINDRGQIAAQGQTAAGIRAVLLTPRGMGTQFSGGIGDLPESAVQSRVLAVADRAVAAGGSGTSANGVDAMFWNVVDEMTGMRFNAVPSSPTSSVRGMSANGLFAAGGNGVTGRAFRLNTSSRTVSDLQNLSGQPAAEATAIDAEGIYATGWSGTTDKSTQRAVRWSGVNLSDEITPLAGGSRAEGLGISGNGSVITGWSDHAGGAQQGFRWSDSDGVTHPLGFLPGGSTSAGTAVSADGTTIVGLAQNAGGQSAFRWTQAGGMQDLGDFPGGAYDAGAHAVSGDGSVVVGHGSNAGGQKALVWDTNHGRRELQSVLASEYAVQFPGWTLTSANAISPDAGTIGGEGIDPLGNTQAWIAQVNSRTWRFVSGESYGGGVFHTSRLGGFGSECDLLGGSAGGAVGSFRTVTVAMQGSQSSPSAPVDGYCADIASVTGTDTDTYVIQMNYDASATGGVTLGWFNGSQWAGATDGNSGGSPVSITGAFDGNATLGRFGVDAANHVVWAVVNHGGQFTALKLTAPPAAAVLAASNVGTNLATLNGSVNALGFDTVVTFQIGTDGNSFPISASAIPSSVSGSTAQPVSATVIGLSKGVTYYCRVIAVNAAGTTVSGVSTFTTLTDPVCMVLAANGITSQSARLNGRVNAMGAASTVFFEYGTNGIDFPNIIGATPSVVNGSTDTTVEATISGLSQSTTYYYRLRATSLGGEGVSSVATFQPDVLSGFTQVFPNVPPSSEGFLTVNLTPGGILHGWRFVGEQQWRPAGLPVAGLTTSNREIEFRPVPGFVQPEPEPVQIVSGEAAVYAYEYISGGNTGSGSVLVTLKPATLTGAQWRLLGETDAQWRNSDTTLTGLPPGNYLIECKPVAGRATPANVNATVTNGQTASVTITYFLPDAATGTSPAVLSFESVSTDTTQPYAYVGQFRSQVGNSSGFVVKPRVVATAAHVVWDDGRVVSDGQGGSTLAAVQGLQWLFQRYRGVHEPAPLIPRGFYTFDGYAAQRVADNSPGDSSPASQHRDVAAVYFSTNAGRGGYGGFLASDLTQNEFLLSSANKTLVGYPIDGISSTSQGRMHATAPFNVVFSTSYGRTFTTSGIRSSGGNSGGPLCVQFEGGAYYPAAIYLGGDDQTVVRAIDSEVVDLFNRAEISSNGGDNNTGGGITHTSISGTTSSTTGSVQIHIEPEAARNAGAGWRLGTSGSYRVSGQVRSSVTPGSYTLDLLTVPGFQPPTSPTLLVTGGQLITQTFTYESAMTPQESWRQTHFGSTANSGDGANGNDFDHDGFTNSQEYAAGTNPTLNGDFFKAENPQRIGSTFTLSTAGKAGRTYGLERSVNLSSWTPIATQGPLASDGAVTLSDAASTGSAFFYRIRVTGP